MASDVENKNNKCFSFYYYCYQVIRSQLGNINSQNKNYRYFNKKTKPPNCQMKLKKKKSYRKEKVLSIFNNFSFS